MVLSISTNTSAINVQRNLNKANEASASSLAKLSSGSRVPTAKDDAASLAIGSRVEAEIAGLKQASTNASQATSLLQIADGAYGEINDILVRQSSLAIQSSSGQLSDSERAILNSEFQELTSEVDRIAQDTEFNGSTLINGDANGKLITANANKTTLDGLGIELEGFDTLKDTDTVGIAFAEGTDRFTVTVTTAEGSTVYSPTETAGGALENKTLEVGGGLSLKLTNFVGTRAADLANTALTIGAGPVGEKSFEFKVGTGIDASDKITTSVKSANAAALGTDSLAINTKAGADAAITATKAAINTLQDSRASVGASLSRLDFASSNLSVTIENQSAAKSGLLDVDVATETTNFASQQVIVQAGVSLLAQANQRPSQLLKLIG